MARMGRQPEIVNALDGRVACQKARHGQAVLILEARPPTTWSIRDENALSGLHKTCKVDTKPAIGLQNPAYSSYAPKTVEADPDNALLADYVADK
jgi:hypothetical protein